MYTTIY